MRALTLNEVALVKGAGDGGAAIGCIAGAGLVYYGSRATATAAGAVFGVGGALIGYAAGSAFAANPVVQAASCAAGGYFGSWLQNWWDGQ